MYLTLLDRLTYNTTIDSIKTLAWLELMLIVGLQGSDLVHLDQCAELCRRLAACLVFGLAQLGEWTTERAECIETASRVICVQ